MYRLSHPLQISLHFRGQLYNRAEQVLLRVIEVNQDLLFLDIKTEREYKLHFTLKIFIFI